MPAYLNDLLDHIYQAHFDIGRALDGLSREALDWIPGPDMNSLAVLVVHLTGSERQWIGLAVNDLPDRDRQAEFLVKGLDGGQLKTRLAAADDFARQALARLSLADLEAERRSPQNDKTYTVGGCLVHALQHTALHEGHIQITRQLWDHQDPSLAK